MPEIKPDEVEKFASIKVIGIGGAGGSAVNRMKEANLKGVEFIAMNTDAQALHNSRADRTVHLGQKITGGLGAGADPMVGEQAAEESREDIKQALEGADMAFITIGAGGGTGSGAGHIVAEEARKMGVLTVGVATRPFTFEGAKRRANADWAIDKLRHEVDTLITIPNDRLLQTIDPKTRLEDTFKIADDVLRQGVQGISELITEHSLINLDFADVQTVMRNAGSALMGIGRASGENRAVQAAEQAIESPLVEVAIDGAKGVLFNVTGGQDISMSEIQGVAEVITNSVASDANIIFGATVRPELDDELIVTVIATGFDKGKTAVAEIAPAPVEEPEPVVENEIADSGDNWVSDPLATSDFVHGHHNPTDITMEESMGQMLEDDNNDDIPALLKNRMKKQADSNKV
ncbi:MAG: cell division protein FtsZ [Candidatus Nomurabacteria bacterium]|jgi:cell division protein FtsZ|nr:cell division protein FtsZ [Candidatus Nomurabacteria bacterium]